MKSRKPLRIEIKPGSKIKLKNAFVARGKNNNLQVFRRGEKKGRLPIIAQRVASIATKLENDKTGFAKLLAKIRIIQFIETDKAISNQLDKLKL